MENEIEIEIGDIREDVPDETPLPINFITEGSIGNDDVRVYIRQDVYHALEKYALEDTGHERGTFLFGRYADAHNKKHVIISDFIPAKYTDASASTLTFTHETWEFVHREHERRYPEKKMIGWQHTHPDYGIFLSNYDLFIHENFFNLDFQIAYVIDPIRKTRGFFQWKNGRVEKLSGFYIYDEEGIKIKQPSAGAVTEKNRIPSSGGGMIRIALSLLCAAVIVLGISFISLNRKYTKQFTEQNVLLQKMSEYEDTIDELNEKIGSFDKTPAAQPVVGDTETDEPSTAVQPAAGRPEIGLIRYTIEEGDTLVSVCAKNGIDYGANINFILSLNGIDDPDKIISGETLYLPVDNNN